MLLDPCQGERQTKLSLLTNFEFKLVVSFALPRTHQENYTFGWRGRGAGKRPMQSRKPRFARLCVVGACLACASSSCHTWSPNYVASRGLNTHRGGGGSSRLLAAARSFPSKKSTERAPPLIKVCLPSPPYLVNVC